MSATAVNGKDPRATLLILLSFVAALYTLNAKGRTSLLDLSSPYSVQIAADLMKAAESQCLSDSDEHRRMNDVAEVAASLPEPAQRKKGGCCL